MVSKWTELVGRTRGVIIDADTAMADWTPSHAGRIKKIKVVVGGVAATSLIENGYIRIQSSGFGGVDLYCPFNGGGIFTAVWERAGSCIQVTECDLPVTQTPHKVYYYHNVLPTTPEITVFAEIEAPSM